MAEYQLAMALRGAGREADAARALERAAALNPAHRDLAAEVADARAKSGT
jgi:hypothetical protein